MSMSEWCSTLDGVALFLWVVLEEVACGVLEELACGALKSELVSGALKYLALGVSGAFSLFFFG